MILIVVLRKEVADESEAQTLAQTVKDFLIEKPEITITASVSNEITLLDGGD